MVSSVKPNTDLPCLTLNDTNTQLCRGTSEHSFFTPSCKAKTHLVAKFILPFGRSGGWKETEEGGESARIRLTAAYCWPSVLFQLELLRVSVALHHSSLCVDVSGEAGRQKRGLNPPIGCHSRVPGAEEARKRRGGRGREDRKEQGRKRGRGTTRDESEG